MKEAQEIIILRIPNLGDLGEPKGPVTRGAPLDTTDQNVDIEIEIADATVAERAELTRDPSVQSTAPSVPIKLHEPVATGLDVDDDTETWGIRAIGADTSSFDGKGIAVAVLDTGIDADHAAFSKVRIVERDFTGTGNGDTHGHGTHCAGTIFGGMVDGLRIGVAPGIDRALIGKVLGGNGGGSGTIVQAMQWAMNDGANIISMSLGIDFPGFVKRLEQTGWPTELATSAALVGYRDNLNLFGSFARFSNFTGAFSQPCMAIAASGNESQRDVDEAFEISVAPPAAAESILAVGALGEGPNGFETAVFSNSEADVGAPGVNVVSAKSGGGLTGMSGTSMATPHVAGVAALLGQELIETTGRLNIGALSGRIVSRATFDGLNPAKANAGQVGTGLVQAP